MKLSDELTLLQASKWNWAGLAARAKDNWANDVLGWIPVGRRHTYNLVATNSMKQLRIVMTAMMMRMTMMTMMMMMPSSRRFLLEAAP